MKKFSVLVEFLATIEAKNEKEAREKAVDMIHGSAGIENVTCEEQE